MKILPFHIFYLNKTALLSLTTSTNTVIRNLRIQLIVFFYEEHEKNVFFKIMLSTSALI